MRTISLCCLLLLSACQSSDPVAWKTYRDEYGAHVRIPDGYTTNESRYQTGLGELTVQSAYWRNREWLTERLGTKLLDFSCFEVPIAYDNYSRMALIDKCLSFWKEYYAVSRYGRIVRSGGLVAGSKFPGKCFQAYLDTGKEDSLFLYIGVTECKGRIYVIHANGYKNGYGAESIRQFTDSFKPE